jgi:hypothetical protein
MISIPSSYTQALGRQQQHRPAAQRASTTKKTAAKQSSDCRAAPPAAAAAGRPNPHQHAQHHENIHKTTNFSIGVLFAPVADYTLAARVVGGSAGSDLGFSQTTKS